MDLLVKMMPPNPVHFKPFFTLYIHLIISNEGEYTEVFVLKSLKVAFANC
jgi:hypothetical protein